MNETSIEKTDQVVEHLCDLILGNKMSMDGKTTMTLALANLIEAKASVETNREIGQNPITMKAEEHFCNLKLFREAGSNAQRMYLDDKLINGVMSYSLDDCRRGMAELTLKLTVNFPPKQ